ncbi:MAG: FAD-dependent oxidoreductase, partial [Raoultibacter sp.]
MIEISNISLSLDAGLLGSEFLVCRAAARVLGVSENDIVETCILRRSVDARKKSDVHFVATLG